MPRMMAMVSLAALLGACSSDADRAAAPDGAVDLATVDLAAGPPPDSKAAPKPDICTPGCHWDCFGGSSIRCYGGKVWTFGGGAPVACCKWSDPWPHGPGPACSMGSAHHACKDAKCQAMDPRYEHCFNPKTKDVPSVTEKVHPHLFRLYCPAEVRFSRAGDACVADADCRPMQASVKGRLVCDPVTARCKEVARPAAPASLGKSCGIKETAGIPFYKTDLAVLDPKTGVLCHLFWDSQKSCLAQGVTAACKLDEDCPAGMVCVCVLSYIATPLAPGVTQVCAAASGRDSVAGRTAGLKCP